MSKIKTPLGFLADLNLDDLETQAKILSYDKHQMLEGFVFEKLFDELLESSETFASRYSYADVQTAIVKTRSGTKFAFVLVWRSGAAVQRYLDLISREMSVWEVSFDKKNNTFAAKRFIHPALQAMIGCEHLTEVDLNPQQLQDVLASLGDIYEPNRIIDKSVRDQNRQSEAIKLMNEVSNIEGLKRFVIERVFFNFAISTYFSSVWNIDKVISADDCLWFAEIKHKFPKRHGYSFGLNDGEVHNMEWAAKLGIRNLHVIFVKPIWDKHFPSGRILKDPKMAASMAIIAREIDHKAAVAILAGDVRVSGEDTSMSGRAKVPYRDLQVADFTRIGFKTDRIDLLSSRLVDVLEGIGGWKCHKYELKNLRLWRRDERAGFSKRQSFHRARSSHPASQSGITSAGHY